jgi:hypothetical protein
MGRMRSCIRGSRFRGSGVQGSKFKVLQADWIAGHRNEPCSKALFNQKNIELLTGNFELQTPVRQKIFPHPTYFPLSLGPGRKEVKEGGKKTSNLYFLPIFPVKKFLYKHYLSRKAEGNGPMKP